MDEHHVMGSLTDRQMQALLDPWFEELVRTRLDEMSPTTRPEFNLWATGMRAGWWSPEEIGARIGPMPPLAALSLDTIVNSFDRTEHLAVGLSIDSTRPILFCILGVIRFSIAHSRSRSRA